MSASTNQSTSSFKLAVAALVTAVFPQVFRPFLIVMILVFAGLIFGNFKAGSLPSSIT